MGVAVGVDSHKSSLATAVLDELGGVVGAIDPDQFNQLITSTGRPRCGAGCSGRWALDWRIDR
jgi:hypothetical protein